MNNFIYYELLNKIAAKEARYRELSLSDSSTLQKAAKRTLETIKELREAANSLSYNEGTK